MIDYTTILQHGEQNAIKSADLAARLGFENTRQLQVDIAKARGNGVMILSSGRGYYLPSSKAEVERFVETMRSRALNTLKAIKTANRYLRQVPGQTEMEETA